MYSTTSDALKLRFLVVKKNEGFGNIDDIDYTFTFKNKMHRFNRLKCMD